MPRERGGLGAIRVLREFNLYRKEVEIVIHTKNAVCRPDYSLPRGLLSTKISQKSGCRSRVRGLGFLGTSRVEQDDIGLAPVANWSAPSLGVAIAGGSAEPPAPG